MKIRVIAALVLCCSACDVPAPVARPVTKPVEVMQSDAGEKAPVNTSAEPESKPEPEVVTERDAQRYALVAARKVLTEILTSPSTAEYPASVELAIEPLPDLTDGVDTVKRFLVQGYVDSPNGFGAITRTRWQSTVGYNPATGNWTTWRFIADDEEIFALPGYSDRLNVLMTTDNTEAPATESPPEKPERQPKERPQLSNEQIAANKLKLAKILLGKNPKVARERLQEIADDYPDTDAADEANILLGDVKDD